MMRCILAVATLTACAEPAPTDDGPPPTDGSPPPTGELIVSTSVTGVQPDPDGYTFVVDDGSPEAIAPEEVVTVPGVTEGSHTVTLGDVALNCPLAGEPLRSVEVAAEAPAAVAFAVACDPALDDQLVFASDRDSAALGVFAAQADGGDVIPLASAGYALGAYAPAVSPDGRTVAYTVVSFGFVSTTYALWLVDADGTDQRLLTSGALPSWSPDASRLVYADQVNGAWDLFVVDVDDPDPVNITETPGVDELSPDWSPDGARIVYERAEDLWLCDADGADAAPLTTSTAVEVDPAWSPDGAQIAFASDQPLRGDEAFGDMEITVIGVDGSGRRALGLNAVDDVGPAWSPTGDRLLFTRAVDEDDTDIFVMTVDGEDVTPLVTHPGADVTTASSWAAPLGGGAMSRR